MRTQDNIQMGEAKLGLLRYDRAQMGSCYFDTDLRYVEINDWLAAINGLSPAEHVGRTVGEVLPSVAEGVERQLRQVIETGEPILKGWAYAETAAHPGVKRFYQHDYYPDKSADGTVLGVECIVKNITHQRLAESGRGYQKRPSRLENVRHPFQQESGCDHSACTHLPSAKLAPTALTSRCRRRSSTRILVTGTSASL